MTDQQTWLSALAEAAALHRVELPRFGAVGMGALRSSSVQGRFVTLKRVLAKEDGGVEWALWHEPSDAPVLVAAFRDPVAPGEGRVALTWPLLKGWLLDQWTPAEAKQAVSKHPGVRVVKDPPRHLAEKR